MWGYLNAKSDPAGWVHKLPFDGHRRLVLVVDDNVFDQEMTVRLLRQAWPFESGLVIERAAMGERH